MLTPLISATDANLMKQYLSFTFPETVDDSEYDFFAEMIKPCKDRPLHQATDPTISNLPSRKHQSHAALWRDEKSLIPGLSLDLDK
jgi:hypothetical protein